MSERFERLYKLPENLYINGAPVIISAGALLKDTATGSVVAQIKFHSVTENIIKAVKVSLCAYDVSGTEIQGVKDYQYLDLSIRNGQEFGSNKAIVLPSAVTRSFSIADITIVFFNGSQWKCEDTTGLEELPVPKYLHTQLLNSELEKQYKISTTPSAAYVPFETMSIWSCACGEWNVALKCTKCGSAKQIIFSALNINTLQIDADKRIAIEQAQQAEAARIAAETAKKQKELEAKKKIATKKRNKIIAIVGAPILAVILLFAFWINPYVLRYSKAVDLIEEKQYEEAYELFSRLNNYKDSELYLDAFEWVCIEEYASGDYISKFEYDETGRLLRHSKQYYEYDTLDATYEYIYDENGLLSKVVKKDDDGEVDTTTTYTYDENGLLLEEYEDWTYFEYITKYTYDENGYVINEEQLRRDKDENTEFLFDWKITYVNDSEGKVIKETFSEDGKESEYEYTYDEHGLCISRTTVSTGKVYKYSRIFDDYGRVESCIETHHDGSTQKITYTYDLIFSFEEYLAGQENEVIYKKALQMLDDEQYGLAVEFLSFLGDYKDCRERINNLKNSDIKMQCYLASVGDTVLYGEYEQDNNVENGKEVVEWIVIDKTKDSVFLLAKSCLSAQQYHTSDDNVIEWKESSLRMWLNDNFINDIFSKEQQSVLIRNDDGDLCSLLTLEQFDEFVKNYDYRISHYTAYAHSIAGPFLKEYSDNFPNSWWIRSSSYQSTQFGYWYKDVNYEGETNLYASPESTNGVRPCISIAIS